MKRFLFLLQLFLLLGYSATMAYSSVSFVRPTDGALLQISPGQSSYYLNIQYTYHSNSPLSYIELFTDQGTFNHFNVDEGIPQWLYVSPGGHEWRIELHEYDGGGGDEVTAYQTITFYIQALVILRNPIAGGHVWLDGTSQSSGTQVFKVPGVTLALESRDETLSGINYSWNSTGNYSSNWKTAPYNSSTRTDIPSATQSAYNYVMQSSDNGRSIFTDPKMIFNINRNDFMPEVSATVNNGLQFRVFEQNTGSLSAPASITDANNNTYNFSRWSEYFANENPRTITPTDNTTYTAVYKALSGTNSTSNFARPGAHKIVKSNPTTSYPNGILHNVYESMGKIWYETSSDNGSTWQIQNSCLSISGNDSYSNPAIAFNVNTGTDIYVGITYYRLNSNGYYDLMLTAFRYTGTDAPFYYNSIIAASNIYKGTNDELYAAIEMNSNEVMIVYGSSSTNNLFYWYGLIGWSSGFTTNSTGTITGSLSKKNPALASLGNGSGGFHLVYETGASSICYSLLTPNGGGGIDQTTPIDISTGSGFTQQHDPSVVVLPDGEARVVWTGYGTLVDPATDEEYTEYTTVFRGVNSNNQFWNFDDYVRQASINRTVDGVNGGGYLIGWVKQSGSTYQNYFMKNNAFYVFHDFGTTGRYLQVSNGFHTSGNYIDMKGLALNTAQSPYKLTKSSSSVMQKALPNNISLYRSGVAFRDSAQFRFRFGDIRVDGRPVAFPEIPDSVVINTIESANKYLVTQPFLLTDNSSFSYNVLYTAVDTANALGVLGATDRVSFKLRLEDATTGEVLGSYDEAAFTRTNLSQHKNAGYEVDANGIGSRNVVLRLVAGSSTPMQYAVTQKVAFEQVLDKKLLNKVSYNGKVVVKDYALSQNYPNPFNPTTVINYQLPKAGRVTLRIYDMLGKEVVKLVDEEKSAGQYQAEFNASHLASGVYFYQLECNDFKAIKKMSLIK